VDPTISAARGLFDDAVRLLRGSIEGASGDVLNGRPAGEDTNPIAVLATHAMFSTRMWLACALGTAIPGRDRPAEFRATGNESELLALVDDVATECRAILTEETAFEPGVPREEPPTSPGTPPSGERVTAAWALLHALEHLHEHAGQASLTRQILDRGA
jgi:hypothetical protein